MRWAVAPGALAVLTKQARLEQFYAVLYDAASPPASGTKNSAP